MGSLTEGTTLKREIVLVKLWRISQIMPPGLRKMPWAKLRSALVEKGKTGLRESRWSGKSASDTVRRRKQNADLSMAKTKERMEKKVPHGIKWQEQYGKKEYPFGTQKRISAVLEPPHAEKESTGSLYSSGIPRRSVLIHSHADAGILSGIAETGLGVDIGTSDPSDGTSDPRCGTAMKNEKDVTRNRRSRCADSK